jgi:hypothetical protein
MSVSHAASTTAALLLILAAAAACSESQGSFGTSQGVQPLCPSTPEATIGARCAVPGLRCGPQYACGILQASLLCVCTDGIFQCTDGTGRQLRDGGRAMCPMPGPGSSCPSTERGAQLASCDEQGLLCAYPSPCASKLDQCECFPGATADGGFGLRFECIPAVCPGSEAGSTPVESGDDGGPSDSATETSTDSSADSNTDTGHDDGGETDALPSDARAD